MAIDFKNIKFKYIKVNGGAPTVDTQMTDKVFDTTKPQGIYKCFTFAGKGFGGNDYNDLKNLVSIESSNLWDKLNRDTFLGFNEETRKFIVNLNGWLSLKNDYLKTDGELPHSDQAGWFEVNVDTSKNSNSKFEILQVDGSKIWLSIKPFELKSEQGGIYNTYPSTAVESEEKSVLGSGLFQSNGALFAKCADDNSVIMVNDCVESFSMSGGNVKLSRSDKEYGKGEVQSSTYQYGKKIFSFESTTSLNPISTAYQNICIQNKSSSTEFELTKTGNLEDILASGESLTFMTNAKCKGIKFVNASYSLNSKNIDRPFSHTYDYKDGHKNYFGAPYSEYKNSKVLFTQNSDKSIKGLPFEMISCDSRKPFIYSPSTGGFIIGGISLDFYLKQLINIREMASNIPSGFIFVFAGKNPNKIYMFKGGKIYQKSLSSPQSFITVTGTTQLGNELYDSKNILNKFASFSVSKNDLINEVGFTEYGSGEDLILSTVFYSTFLITVLKV